MVSFLGMNLIIGMINDWLLVQVTTVGVVDQVYQPGVRVPSVLPKSVAESAGMQWQISMNCHTCFYYGHHHCLQVDLASRSW